MSLRSVFEDFPCGSMGQGSGVITAVAQVPSPAWELPHVTGTAKKKKKKMGERRFFSDFCFALF